MELARQGRNQPAANAPGANPTVSPKNIDDLRQQLTGVREPGAYQARQWLDQFMASPQAVVRGTDAQRNEITRLLAEGRGDWRAAKRTQTIEEANQYAADRAATADSGRNVGNTYRQKLVALLNPKSSEGRWYTPEEKADIRTVTRREGAADVARLGGNLMGGGGGAYAGVLGTGGLASSFMSGDWRPAAVGFGVPAAGMALRGMTNRGTVAAAENLADTMAMRSPLYRARAANAPVVGGPGLGNLGESSRNAITIEMLNQLKQRGYMAPEAE
jgi:hypothetical protein